MSMISVVCWRLRALPGFHESSLLRVGVGVGTLLLPLLAACGDSASFTPKASTQKEIPNAADATAASSSASSAGNVTPSAAAGASSVATSSSLEALASDGVTQRVAVLATGATTASVATPNVGTTVAATGTDLSAGSQVAAATPMPAAPIAVVIPPNCSASGATQANLLSLSIDNSLSIAHLDYQIFRTDCQGNIQALTAAKIMFDVDAEVKQFASITYTMESAASTQSGMMDDIVGSDLFGDTGTNFAHWQTDQAVTITGVTDSVILHIDMPATPVVPRSGPATQVSTYLSFGDAAPVTKVVQIID